MLNKQHCSSHGSCCVCIARWSSWVWSGLEGTFMTAFACQNHQNEHVSVPNPVARRGLCSWGKGKALPSDRPVFGPCAVPCCLFFLYSCMINCFIFFVLFSIWPPGWMPPQFRLGHKRGGLWEWINEDLNTRPECFAAALHCVCWGNEGRSDEGAGFEGCWRRGDEGTGGGWY